ncbi:hypothetical protein J7I98_36015 [Streptomyces sp. ISL-98]|uniref:hypothetical protein n=1 Tax=Streptomyces sp. ISL-98 TaxID=2819192 RepID=UPI001BEB5062|nr:hypothetical protein [Streptomyces sp. ISL-98]MBT2511131.1 hypothetical protein [Streptomyces sp. ISL-98]
MSRLLFAACEQLHYEDLAIAERTPGLCSEDQRIADEPADEEAEDQRRRSYSPSPPSSAGPRPDSRHPSRLAICRPNLLHQHPAPGGDEPDDEMDGACPHLRS